MITRRPADQRGHTKIGWLDSWHSFSFGEFYDPAFMGYGPLRVINDDNIAAGAGFGTHPHRDMEIITVVYSGAVEHRDSTGGSGVIEPGDVQVMSAGSGIRHSEFNHHKDRPLHLLQIWIMPDERGLTPGYQQKRIERKPNTLTPIATPDGRDGSMLIHQDASVYAATLQKGGTVELALATGRKAWVQVARGAASVNGVKLETGDGAAIEAETTLTMKSEDQAELLVFDMV